MPDVHIPTAYAIAWAVGLCLVGGLMTPRGDWYEKLKKPTWQPPGWLFGPAWTTILGLAAWAGVRAWGAATPAQQPDVLIAFAVNGVFHLAWSPLFFRAQRPDWALGEVPFLWASVLAMIVAMAPIDPLAPVLLAPYILWVSFATFLNWTIVRLNPRPLAAVRPAG